MSQKDAIAIAKAHALREFPQFDVQKPPTSAWETDKAWVVTYNPDPRSLGGLLTVVVDKKNEDVFVAFGEQ